MGGHPHYEHHHRRRELFDIAPDGKRIIFLPEPDRTAARKENLHLIFLLNFFDEVRRRMPAGGK